MSKKLLFYVTIHDCEVQTFRCGGHGGQNVNKVESGVRIIHQPSGAVTQSCETRDQFRNKRLAFKRLVQTPEFKKWHRIEVARRLGAKSVEELVDEAMAPDNIKVEGRDNEGRWVRL